MALLTPLLLGMGAEYSRIQSESDKITGKIVDIVAQNVLNELNEEKKNIKKQVALKDSYTNQYGSKFSQAVDALGLLESGDPERADALIKNYFQTTDLATIKNKVDKLNTKDFQNLFSESRVLGKKTQVEDKQKFVNEQFSDVPNLRKIMLEGRETGGGQIGQALFGDIVRQRDIPVAVEKLTRAAGGPIPTPKQIDTMGASRALGITPFAEKSFMELKRGSAEEFRAATAMQNEAQQEFQNRKIYAGVYQKDPLIEKEYQQVKKNWETETKTPYPYTERDYDFNFKFLPAFIEQTYGRPFAPKTAPKKQPSVNLSGIQPDQLTKFANQRISELESNKSSSYDPSRDIELIRSTTRIQLEKIGVDPRTYGF
jgi:hypothetical protein